MVNRIEAGYTNIPPLMETMSRYELGEEVPPPVKLAWDNLSVSMRICDYLLDSTPDPLVKRSVAIDAMSYLSNDKQELEHGNPTYHEQMGGLRGYLSTLPPERARMFGLDLRKLITVSGRTATAQNAEELIRVRNLEGELSARLFLDLLPPEYSNIEGYRNFRKTILRIGRIGNIVDTLVDFDDDHEAGEVIVTPSLSNKIKLMMNASGQAFLVLKSVNKRMLPQLGAGVIQAYRRKSSHGSKPSDLQ